MGLPVCLGSQAGPECAPGDLAASPGPLLGYLLLFHTIFSFLTWGLRQTRKVI